MKILIKGGRVLNPATSMDEIADVLIEENKVVAIGKAIDESADRVIDAEGKFVMPGFIDLHVHFRDPGLTHKEDIMTGMAAAAHGGFTSVFAMPNTKPVADNADVIRYVQKFRESEEMKEYLAKFEKMREDYKLSILKSAERGGR